MKWNAFMAAGIAGCMLAGCATSHDRMELGTVGPAPGTGASSGTTTGTLTVYSAFAPGADFNREDPYRREYSDYTIFKADGHLERPVHNNSGTVLQRPQRVELPAGTYRVLAQANGYGLVTVPVSIVAGQETLVHLEGGFQWPNQREFKGADAVRLPDGEIVGWKSTVP